MKIIDITVETAIVPFEHQFVWRTGLPGSGTEQDTIRIVIEPAEVHGGGLPNPAIACAIPNTTWYETLVRTNLITVEDGIGPDDCISPPEVPGIGWETAGSRPLPSLDGERRKRQNARRRRRAF